ncbi:hypothetical protein QFC19_007572 [Naganishia cerealis]|uniref:Uncharacterized protein n=1 Tax=Naganishia cerealis TaxID=610337 RepID=A0ACC2VA77_9TREE|nr:hypothetical protein QFC19_007572 [Naganishia cerealis]
MSHPAASVKSIYSGKVNLDREGMDPYGYDEDMDDIHDKIESPSSHVSNLSVSSRNLRTLNDTMVQPPNNKLMYKQDSSTNISIASSSSDYQNNVNDLNDVTNLSVDITSDTSSPAGMDRNQETVQFEGSRPMSRNSTTSCLSTTATKDGVEGKRFHRYGPSPYSAAIIQNMIQTHNLQEDYSPSYAAKPQLSGTPGYGIPFSPSVADLNNMSLVSLQTTNAEFDGEPGERRMIQIEEYSNSVPPVSLKEKINLLDNDR